MRCRSAGQAGHEVPDSEKHNFLLDQCANFGLLDELYCQLVAYVQLSPDGMGPMAQGLSWSKKQQTAILQTEMKATFGSFQSYLQDTLLPKLRLNGKKDETINQDHKARVVEAEFYQALQGTLVEQMQSDSRVQAAVAAVCGLQQYQTLSLEQLLGVSEHIVTQVFGMLAMPMESLGVQKHSKLPSVKSLQLPALGSPHPPSSPLHLPDRLAGASRCSTEDIYNTPRISSHRGSVPRSMMNDDHTASMPNSARAHPTVQRLLPTEMDPPASPNTLAGRRQLMASQGSVVEDGVEFTELSQQKRTKLQQQLSSLNFDVSTLPRTELCDVVKFCFHSLGVASWYELSAAAVHSLVTEAASVHYAQDMRGPPPPGCSSWALTVHWCHMVYWMLKVGGVARFLTYFDVFALLTAITQVGTHQRCCWLSAGAHSNSNDQARLRMRLSTQLSTLHHYVGAAGGVFNSLTPTEIASMKRKLTNCFEACKQLCLGQPMTLTSEQQQQLAMGMAKIPSSSNIAHNRALQRSSSRFRSTLMRLLFHASAVGSVGLEQSIGMQTVQWTLAVAQVSKEELAVYAQRYLQQSTTLFRGLKGLGLSNVAPLLTNMELLGQHYATQARLQGHKKHKIRRNKKNHHSNQFALPPLVKSK